jgi:hypothetical protein
VVCVVECKPSARERRFLEVEDVDHIANGHSWRFEKLVNPSTKEGHTVLGAVSIGLELCNYGFAGCSKDHLGRKSEP